MKIQNFSLEQVNINWEIAIKLKWGKGGSGDKMDWILVWAPGYTKQSYDTNKYLKRKNKKGEKKKTIQNTQEW